jgi:Rrf2 family protein
MEVIKRDTDYAFRAMVHLARKHPHIVSAGELAESQCIPAAFLQKLLQKLSHAGLVQSHRGIRGGFRLAREPRDVTAEDIVEAVQGEITMNRCLLENAECDNSGACSVQKRLLGIQQDLKKSLQAVTLQELAGDTRENAR